jgi:hypothetical protein
MTPVGCPVLTTTSGTSPVRRAGITWPSSISPSMAPMTHRNVLTERTGVRSVNWSKNRLASRNSRFQTIAKL